MLTVVIRTGLVSAWHVAKRLLLDGNCTEDNEVWREKKIGQELEVVVSSIRD
jgi:hypothetical protein